MPLAESLTSTPIWPAGSELIIGTICFVVVFGILGKLLMPRIVKTLNEREDAIQGGINRADEAQAEAQAVLTQYRTQLEDAKHESARIQLYMWIGFALTEALALIGLIAPFIFKY